MTDKQLAGMIVIDGVDGAGKGVQSRRLLAAMEAAGHQVLLTREPGGSVGAEEIRRLVVEGEPGKWDALTELLLINAARRSHLIDTVWPALARGCWVICDRYADSSRAFQGVAGGLGLDVVEQFHSHVAGDFVPALTVILDLDPEISLARAAARAGGEDRFEKKGGAFQQRVRQAFCDIASAAPETHELIDADASIDEVSQRLQQVLSTRCGLELSLVV